MKYWKMFKDGRCKVVEITKEEAKKTLTGYWDKKFLNDIFKNDKAFQLDTPYSIIWTENEFGLVPMAGFYGVVGE